MPNKNIKNILLLVLIVACGYVWNTSQDFLSRGNNTASEREEDLYLPETGYLKFISLGHNGLVSDLVLAKALTYFGSHYTQRRAFRFKHLKKLFFTAIDMDPMNKDAVLMAGNILSDIDTRSALEALEKGMKYHPRYWKFPEMIGFQYFFKLNDPGKAAAYYEMASKLPGHPPYIPSLSGKFYEESGMYEEAIRVLYNFYSTTEDKRLKESFKESIQALQEKIKNRDFQLRGVISRVVDGETVEFDRDIHNPRFQFLKPKETLRIIGVTLHNMETQDMKEKLFGLIQKDYADFVLSGQQVRVQFERNPDGDLKRDGDSLNRLQATVTLKNDFVFKQVGIGDFPPQAEDLNPGKVYEKAGKIISIRFTVQEVKFQKDKKGNIGAVFLDSASEYRNTFRVMIPGEYVHYFVGTGTNAEEYFKKMEGSKITVSGLATVKDRRVEMKLYFPMQYL
jgi:tetratricopeptide (TPR) repeat protein